MARTRKKSNIGSSSNKQRQIFYTKMAVVMILIALQIVCLVIMYGIMREYILYWKTAAFALCGFVVLYIVNKQENPAYKLAWVIVLLSFPLVGGAIYVFMSGNRTRRKFINEALKNHMDTFEYTPDDTSVRDEMDAISHSANVQSTYISKTAGYPVYRNTTVKYFPLGEENYETLLKELKAAKHYIFMEYFIIKQGEMWSTILDILIEKVKEGVDVRLIYDDFGCAMWVPSRFNREMEEVGIKVAPFNPVIPLINLRQNNRDHRKITVIDGHTGFTGGINIADEYINKIDRFGHWKDTGVMLKGEGVWNLTLMFLQTWTMITKETDDYKMYNPYLHCEKFDYDDGFVQPYGDTPVDDEIVGENIYLNMINKAKRYIYITTPYLIIDNELVTALTLAAKSGIDVRIITPGIPDKKMVYLVTQSYYYQLIKAGVKVYQYTPGFIHAKTVVMDDSIAVVGTVNFDYRSMYLHFECGVWMYDCKAVKDIKEDYDKTLLACDEVTIEELEKTSKLKLFGQSLLRLFAPLM